MTWRAIQLVIALALPIGFVALAPDRSLLWALVIMAGEIAFAALNRGWTWLVPVAAALVLVQGFVDLGAAAQVVWWISLAVSVAVGVIALAFGRQGPDRSDDSRRVGLLVATALLATGLLTMGVVVGLTRTTDQAFEAGQQSAAESWVNAAPQGVPDGTTRWWRHASGRRR